MMTTTPSLAPIDYDHASERLLATAKRLPLDDWALRYRIVGGSTPLPGPWRHRNAPMAVEPMRALSSDGTRLVTLVAPTQLVKSEFLINVGLYAAVHGDDCLFFEPDEDLAGEFLTDRLRPALIDYPTELITGGAGLKKKDSSLTLRVGGGGAIKGLYPRARSGVVSRSARYVVLDEIDKMGDPRMVTYAHSRITSFGVDGRIVAASTPTIDGPGTIWRLWSEGSRGIWHGRCPRCAELVPLDWSQVFFQKDPDGFWLPDTAVLICAACGAEWSERERLTAVRKGAYIHGNPGASDPSFWVPGPAHLRRSVRDIATVGAKAYRDAARDGAWDTYQVWTNEFAGEVWSEDLRGLSGTRLRRATYPAGGRTEGLCGTLDPRALVVTVGADTGAHALFAEWVAWGIDPHSLQVLSWGLQYEQIGGEPEDDIEGDELWAAFDKQLETAIWRHPTYPQSRFPYQRGCIDTGYRPEIVFAWCRAKLSAELSSQPKVALVSPFAARMLPMRSKSQETGQHPVDLTTGLKRMRTRRERPPAQVWIESNQIKDAIYESVLRDSRLPEAAEPVNAWPNDREARGYTDAWFNEFSNEIKTTRRSAKGVVTTQWAVKHEHGRKNEAFDCRVYAAAAALVWVYPRPLREGLLHLALAEAESAQPTVFDDAAERIRGVLT